jgi:uncharacterized protein YfbU (UPF0304 family)
MKASSISLTERLILAQQSRILAAVDPKQSEDHIFVAEVFENGFTDFYEEAFTAITPEFGKQESEYVRKIMGIYFDIQYSYDNKLTEEERKEVGSVTFPGFDGNDTQDIYRARFALFCMKHGQYQSLKCMGSDLNSHMPVWQKYTDMIRPYEEMGSPRELTADQIKNVMGR